VADNAPEPPGNKAARDHWVQTYLEAQAAARPDAKAHTVDVFGDILERFERELGPHLEPFLSDVVANPNIPEPVRALLGAIVEPQHFTQSLLIGVALGSVISPVLGAATAPFIQTLANEVWPTNPSIPLSPPEIALGVIRHNPHVTNPEGEAAKSGISAANLAALEYNTGEALAVGELLLLFRRKQISQDRLVTGLRQSRIRDEWLPEILDLQYAPPGAGEVIAGLTKGHLTPAEASTKLGEAGINPTNLEWLHATAGRPPGIEQMLHLWNRDEATIDDVTAAVLQSDINNTYLPFILKLREYHPPPRSIVPMLRNGAITEARARTLLRQSGLIAEDVDAFVKEAQHSSTHVAAAKDASQSAVVRAYEQRLLTNAQATAKLTALGYTADAITLLLEVADNAYADHSRNAAVSKIHAEYVGHRIDKATASADLAKIAVPAAAVNAMLPLWDVEQAANVHRPTPAQTVSAFRRKWLTAAECKTRLLALGVMPADIGVFVVDSFTLKEAAEGVTAANQVLNA
jgi:hypothetical protein